jgi:hypothetical protein
MIYICYIKHRQIIVVSALIVRDDELDVGDDEVASSEVAGVETGAGRGMGRSRGWLRLDDTTGPRGKRLRTSEIAGNCWELLGMGKPRNPL